ncbi:phage Gp37/Gp68 family protein [Bradyrhizobium barranii subsp. barranii]|uniref:Phage Gp37/Gp68 family protein n=1 Tax=Bradyrhizobium barranii subsp. barranii TaxID=2823807 RepID=A0A939M853_9BRAD|nr:phage Gp37/Gp68 family protein [Bradyrhizobium barranii]UEM08610.1 phage Gp37/Gp68 family protein [Bradyrhizobium barranii subsp. barranii]
MATASKIEWTGHTWNPLAGCSVLTPGCKRCYAMKMAARLEAMGQALYVGLTESTKAGPVWTGVMRQASQDVLLAPLRRKKPTTYFVNSMSDLFHENVPDTWIDQVFAVMALAPQHTFQILTKRAARMQRYFELWPEGAARFHHVALEAHKINPDLPSGMPDGWVWQLQKRWPLPNVWLGVSTERQQEADERIPHLLQTPAAVRFISAEPLLGPINLTSINHRGVVGGHSALHDRGLGKLDWVIVGGESGAGSRPMHPAWARVLRDQCAEAGVAFFFKQWGSWVTEDQSPEDIVLPGESRGPWAVRDGEGGWTGDQTQVFNVRKGAAGRLLDGREHNAMPGATA